MNALRGSLADLNARKWLREIGESGRPIPGIARWPRAAES